MGEHCGTKLTDHESMTWIDEDCRICQDIQTKARRLRKERENITRWKNDSRNSFRASIEKAERESEVLEEQIRDLEQKRPRARLSPSQHSLGELKLKLLAH
jgi:flagellar motility protein MotE (MotC chaperone)